MLFVLFLDLLLLFFSLLKQLLYFNKLVILVLIST